MFSDILNDKLSSNESEFLLIGERHNTVSILPEFYNFIPTTKKLIFFLEKLHCKENDLPYDDQDIDSLLIEREEKELLKIFIRNGAEVYGCENDYSNPIENVLMWQKNTLHKLKYDDFQSSEEFYDYCLNFLNNLSRDHFSEDQIEHIKHEVYKLIEDGNIDFAISKIISLTSNYFLKGDKRIMYANQRFSELIYSIYANKSENSLFVFIGGTAHLSKFKQNKNNVIDPGMTQRLKDLGCNNVYQCYAAHTIYSEDIEKGYKPYIDNIDRKNNRIKSVLKVKHYDLNHLFFDNPNNQIIDIRKKTKSSKRKCNIM